MKLSKIYSAFLCFLLTLSVVTPVLGQQSDKGPTVDMEKIFIVTDRYLYKPGERIYLSVQITDEKNRPQTNMCLVNVYLNNPKGQVVDSLNLRITTGKMSAYMSIPQTGGIYTLTAQSTYQKNAREPKLFAKELYVQEYIEKDFFIKQELDRTAYKPGDRVVSNIEVTEAGGTPIKYMEMYCELVVNGSPSQSVRATTDIDGKLTQSLTLPQTQIEDAYFVVSASFRGMSEKESLRVPVLRNDVNLQTFLASGGANLIADIPNKVVIKSFDETGNPRDISGEVKDNLGQTIASFTSLHKGMAEVSFTPKPGRIYRVTCEQAQKEVELPAVVTSGLVFDVVEKENELIATASGSWPKGSVVRAVGGGNILGQKTLPTLGNTFNFSLLKSVANPGVVAFMVLDSNQNVIAKRLALNLPRKHNFKVSYKESEMIPGRAVLMNFESETQEKAWFTVRMIEEQTLNQIKDRSHSIESWMYLGCEFNSDIEEPQFYVDRDKDKSKRARDLLLITLQNQWRRSLANGRLKAIEGTPYARMQGNISGSVWLASDYQKRDGITIRVANTSFETKSDSTGHFEFRNLPGSVLSGEVKIIVSRGLERFEYPVTEYNIWYGDKPLRYRYSPYYINPGIIRLERRVYGRGDIRLLNSRVNSIQSNLSVAGLRSLATKTYIDGVPVTADVMSSIQTIHPLLSESEGLHGFTLYQPEYISYVQPFGVSLYTFGYQYMSRRILGIRPNGQTAFWLGEGETNDTGSYQTYFAIPAKTEGYVLFCEGVTESGKLFTTTKNILIQDPIEAQAKVPPSLTYGDHAQVNIRLRNVKDYEQTVVLATDDQKPNERDTFILQPNEIKVVPVEIQVGFEETHRRFAYTYWFDGVQRFSDPKVIQLVQRGQRKTLAGSEFTDMSRTFEVANQIPQSAELKFMAMTDFQEILTDVTERMIRQPHGCFEQVSSANYPNLLALKLLRSSGNGSRDQLVQYIQNGYNKLVAYETPSKGFEWYGRNPPHEALTAFGLLQFHMMKELGLTVDQKMFNRNLEWLLSRSDGRGGFRHTSGRYGFSGVPGETQDAYITYVLSRIGRRDLTQEIARIEQYQDGHYDAYRLALLANIYVNRSMWQKADSAINQLTKHIRESQTNGKMATLISSGSVVRSYGQSLTNEILALTLIAMSNYNGVRSDDKQFIMKKLIDNRGSYGFGGTQANALALEALSYFSGYFQRIQEEQQYIVKINGKVITTYDATAMHGKPFSIDLDPGLLVNGNNQIEVVCQSNEPAPFSYDIRWNEDNVGEQHEEIGFEYVLSKNDASTADLIFADVTIENKTDSLKPQTVAVISIPGGLSISLEELRTLQKEEAFDYYETHNNELHVYYLNIGPHEKKKLRLALTANVVGDFYTQESYVYQYYTPEIRSTVNLQKLNIKPEVAQ